MYIIELKIQEQRPKEERQAGPETIKEIASR